VEYMMEEEGREERQQEEEEGKVYQCQFCPSTFDRELGLYGHLNSHKEETFQCSLATCSSTFPSLKAFRKHMAEHRGTSHPFQCPQCGLRFDRKSQLGYHIESFHQQVSPGARSLSPLTSQLSSVSCHLSPVTCHL